MRNAARTLIGMAAAIFLLSGASSSLAQEQEGEDELLEAQLDRDCIDNHGWDWCLGDDWAPTVAAFRLEPAEVVQAQGWRGVRVFTVDGYSNDMPMVSVLRKGNDRHTATLEVRSRTYPEYGLADSTILTRTAWMELYRDATKLQELLAKSPQSFHDSAELTEIPGEQEAIVCFHAWVTVTESLTDEGVERRIRNACGRDPLYEQSMALSAQALRGFPHCNHLEPGAYRNESSQLAGCLLLRGDDLVAAASLKNEKGGAPGLYPGDEVTRDEWALWLRTDGTGRLDWAGEVYQEGADPNLGQTARSSLADVMIQIGAILPALMVYQDEYGARTRSEGWIKGAIAYELGEYGEGDYRYMMADYHQEWSRRADGQWQMTNWTVGPFREVGPDDE